MAGQQQQQQQGSKAGVAVKGMAGVGRGFCRLKLCNFFLLFGFLLAFFLPFCAVFIFYATFNCQKAARRVNSSPWAWGVGVGLVAFGWLWVKVNHLYVSARVRLSVKIKRRTLSALPDGA